jgi:hypothetical protein
VITAVNLAVRNLSLLFSRFIDLRNSYQNRPNIGTALLWAAGLAGKKDLQIGLKGRIH